LGNSALPLQVKRVYSAGALGRPNRATIVMPSLIRFLVVVGLLAGLGYGAMWTLANLVEPDTREMTQTIPLERLGR
jgi:hypothetical protein